MKLLLSGPGADAQLAHLYDQAISKATELLIVSAYLTEWRPRVPFTGHCESIVFIVGTDFGLTRKAACEDVLKWLPPAFRSDFLAADEIDGFHPKLVAWRSTNGKYQVLVGSSNLTAAGFSTNYEANVLVRVSPTEFERVRSWVQNIRDRSTPISEGWLASYRESRQTARRGGIAAPTKRLAKTLELPAGKEVEVNILDRRKAQAAFSRIRAELLDLVEKCARGTISNAEFYEQMYTLWGHYPFRFQGRGFEITGKHSDWKDVCTSLSTICARVLATAQLDRVVANEIDRLSRARNPNRGAWLTEMLCHLYPRLYPLVNKPVVTWLRHNRYPAPRGASEGARYQHLALTLRGALKNNTTNGARDLPELDNAIWTWGTQQPGQEG